MNFNYLIYHVNPPKVNGLVDYGYLLNLPTDMYAGRALIDELTRRCVVEVCEEGLRYHFMAYLARTEYMTQAFTTPVDIRGFNVPNLVHYRQTHDVNYQALLEQLQD